MPILHPGEVHVWTAVVEPAAAADLAGALCPQERETARRFHFEQHRQAYVFAHAVLRDILGRYLNRPARDLRFERDPFGKPFLVDAGARIPPYFNLSHSGAIVLVALTCDRQIGADVEQIRPLVDMEHIAKEHFSPEERTFLLRQSPAERERAFFRFWTRKESYIKGLGRGLSIPLKAFDTTIADGKSSRLLEREGETSNVENWWLSDLEVPAGYMGAMTVERGFERTICSQWLSTASALTRQTQNCILPPRRTGWTSC